MCLSSWKALIAAKVKDTIIAAVGEKWACALKFSVTIDKIPGENRFFIC